MVVCHGVTVKKRPSWAIGRSVEAMSDDDSESQNEMAIVKKPSWSIGRDLTAQLQSEEASKQDERAGNNRRFIEFKRFIEFRKDLDDESQPSSLINRIKLAHELMTLYPHLEQKRPSIGARTRSLSKSV